MAFIFGQEHQHISNVVQDIQEWSSFVQRYRSNTKQCASLGLLLRHVSLFDDEFDLRFFHTPFAIFFPRNPLAMWTTYFSTRVDPLWELVRDGSDRV
jgi:hypothetical protein